MTYIILFTWSSQQAACFRSRGSPGRFLWWYRIAHDSTASRTPHPCPRRTTQLPHAWLEKSCYKQHIKKQFPPGAYILLANIFFPPSKYETIFYHIFLNHNFRPFLCFSLSFVPFSLSFLFAYLLSPFISRFLFSPLFSPIRLISFSFFLPILEFFIPPSPGRGRGKWQNIHPWFLHTPAQG